ncbi:MAG: hypothetical protein KF901_20130 [Myxococcales bacterium]|nr:hypothetical protein [Myxococcales bacterium]
MKAGRAKRSPASALVRAVLLVLASALLLGVFASARTSISPAAPPSAEAGAWALAALEAARVGDGAPARPASAAWAGPGAIVVSAWHAGVPIAQHVEASGELVAAVDGAISAFAAERFLASLDAWRARGDERVRFTLECVLGEGPLLPSLPWVEELSLVPIHEGLVARLGDRAIYLTPEELRSRGGYEGGVETPIPDLTFGSPIAALKVRLAGELGVEADELERRGSVRRFRSHLVAESTYPAETEVTEAALRRASVEGAAFLLRHQHRDGKWTYVYDAGAGVERHEAYSLPRHAGTSYFVAQVDALHGMPEAREGALRSLRWLERNSMRRCGEHRCVESHGRADVGSAALTIVAAAEVLAKAPDPLAQRLVEELTAFLRSLQRADGELMHEFDLERQEPVDVQHMYYSGEAAFALLRAHDVLGDERDLQAAQRLMAHLTGAGWDFLGSRYYYGEEHWTCIAAGEGRARVDAEDAIDFCTRWLEFNDRLQFRAGETPWSSAGAFGVGPVLLPRLTPVGSRTEAFINTYLLLKHHGRDTTLARRVVERGLGQLLRWRWAPGPTHLFRDPAAAFGGMPGSPVDPTSRNDFVQHAGSAWIRWADVLREEAAAR